MREGKETGRQNQRTKVSHHDFLILHRMRETSEGANCHCECMLGGISMESPNGIYLKMYKILTTWTAGSEGVSKGPV